jgi:hypothetical protein
MSKLKIYAKNIFFWYFITTPKEVQRAKNIVIWKIKAVTADLFIFIKILKIQNELKKNICVDLHWKYFPGNNLKIVVQVKKESAAHICLLRK